MKKLLFTPLLIIALLLGCNPDVTVTSPYQTGSKSTAALIKLPAPKTLSVETLNTQSKVINGDAGGVFTEQFSYQSDSGPVTISSSLIFPANSFSGNKTITQTFNTETASLDFGPSMSFSAPVKYTLTISGLDLTGISNNSIDFAYIAPDGNIMGVEYDSINIDTATNSIVVANAKLDHFSRYGFINSIIIIFSY